MNFSVFFASPIVPLWPQNDSNNQFIYYICGGIALIYFLVLVIASISRRNEACIVVIPPNETFHDEHLLHKYLLEIKTSLKLGSSCHALARVYIQLVGRKSSSPYYPVDVFYSGRFLFQRGCRDIFLLKVSDNLGEMDVVNFIIVKNKKSTWNPDDVTVMHPASGKRWKVCHSITDIDQGISHDTGEENQSIVLNKRGIVGHYWQLLMMNHMWLSPLTTPIRYGAYTTRMHVLFVCWVLSVLALATLVFFIVTPQKKDNTLLYAIGYACLVTVYATPVLGFMKLFLHLVRSGSKEKIGEYRKSLNEKWREDKVVLNINIPEDRQAVGQKSNALSNASTVNQSQYKYFSDKFHSIMTANESRYKSFSDKFHSIASVSKDTEMSQTNYPDFHSAFTVTESQDEAFSNNLPSDESMGKPLSSHGNYSEDPSFQSIPSERDAESSSLSFHHLSSSSLQKPSTEEENLMKTPSVQKSGTDEESLIKTSLLQKPSTEEELFRKSSSLQKSHLEEENLAKISSLQKSITEEEEEGLMRTSSLQKPSIEEETLIKISAIHHEKSQNKVSITSCKPQSKIEVDKPKSKSVELLISSPEMTARQVAQNIVTFVRRAFHEAVDAALRKKYTETIESVQNCLEILYFVLKEELLPRFECEINNSKGEEVFLGEDQQRSIILRMMNHVIERVAVHSNLSTGMVLMICEELLSYSGMYEHGKQLEVVSSKFHENLVENWEKLMESFIFRVIQSACETIYQTPVCLHTRQYLSKPYALKSAIQNVIEGDIAKDLAVYSLCCDIIEEAEQEVTSEHQVPENVYLEFCIKRTILRRLKKICNSGVLLPDDEVNLAEVRSRLYRKWHREGLQQEMIYSGLLGEVLLLKYAESLDQEGVLKLCDILQNEADFQYMQQMIRRMLIIEVERNLDLTESSFVSSQECQQDLESEIEIKMNRTFVSMRKTLETLTPRVIYEELLQRRGSFLVSNMLQELKHEEMLKQAIKDSVVITVDKDETDMELVDIKELKKDLIPLQRYLKFLESIKTHRKLSSSFLHTSWKFHKHFTSEAFQTLTESALMLTEDSVDKTLTPEILYELEWDMTRENRKPLSGFWMSLFAVFLFATTLFNLVYVAMTGAQLTVDQVTHWSACFLVSVLLYELVIESCLSIFLMN